MFYKALFAGTVLTVIGLGVMLHHFSQTSEILKKYQKLGFVQSDFKYEKVEKSWGEQGLLFYQVQFPFINVPVKADKMSLSLADTGMNLKIKNTHINVIEGLKNIYGSEVAENLNTYVPYKNFSERILTTMAVMGINEFIGDISVNTVYSDAKTMSFKIDMEQENQPTFQISGILHIPVVGAHQFSDLWNGKIDSMDIEVKESFMQHYIDYAKSRKVKLAEDIESGTLKLKKEGNLPLNLRNVLK